MSRANCLLRGPEAGLIRVHRRGSCARRPPQGHLESQQRVRVDPEKVGVKMPRARMPRRIATLLALVSLSAAFVISPSSVKAATPVPASWTPSGNMAEPRGFAPAVLLGDGRVITAGGTDGLTYTATADLWSGGTWSSAGSIGQAAAGQVAALLPNGMALFAGGADAMSYYMHGDLFDPADGSWTQTPAMTHAHAYGVAVSLQNGDVMVIGGYDGGSTLITGAVDVYSAADGTWSAGPSLPEPRYAFVAVTLPDGRVLVAGGDNGALPGSALNTVEIYTPGSGWAPAESLATARADAAAVLLDDGTVLVAGGQGANGVALNTAEVYNPTTGHWTQTGYMTTARVGFSMTDLPDGRVVSAGGFTSGPTRALNTTDLYDPTTGGWTATGKLADARTYQTATKLADGSVMVVGGHGYGAGYLASTEVYTPPPAKLTYPATTYHPVAPTRTLDTRHNEGLSGYFYNATPRLLQVTGRHGVPDNAVAVTGNLTTTLSTAGGVLTIGPVFTPAPNFSTLNFPVKDNRANNVTVGLDPNGQLSIVYLGSGRTHVVFDVTGYFTPDDTGATYVPIAPMRLLDSRNGNGTTKARFATGKERYFQVTGRAGVPDNAVAVTGNFTLVRPTAVGWAFVGPQAALSQVGASTVNAPTGDTRANGVSVMLGAGGKLGAIWSGPAGSTADLLFDVTGYFVNDTSGARFVPIEPTRFVDSRINLPFTGPIVVDYPVTVQIAGRGGIPRAANGMSGNLTVTNQTVAGYMAVQPHFNPGDLPSYSTINFPKGDIRANGFDLNLWPDGTVGVEYEPTDGARANFIIDVTGYFIPSSPA
jgi:hypothetical protein